MQFPTTVALSRTVTEVVPFGNEYDKASFAVVYEFGTLSQQVLGVFPNSFWAQQFVNNLSISKDLAVFNVNTSEEVK